VIGAAGLLGGATRTVGRAGAPAATAGRSVCSSRLGSGWPGFAANACCCRANGTGGGGGGVLAITCRFITAAGGAETRPAVLDLAPRTLSREGATAAVVVMRAEASSRALICTTARPTGCALEKVRCGTAVTAPCTLRFTYVMLVTFVVRLMMVVLYTFVTCVTFTVVFEMLTRFTYPALT